MFSKCFFRVILLSVAGGILLSGTPTGRDCIDDDFGDCCPEPFTVWFDYDGDGLGNPIYPALACYEHEGWVQNPDDPDDTCFSNIIDCNGTCDGLWVEDDLGNCCEELILVFEDQDGDGWGNHLVSAYLCEVLTGWVVNDADKNDDYYCPENYFDVCGVCGGDNSTCTGCTDPAAINYDPDNIIDDGSCIYASEHIWHVDDEGSDITGEGTAANPFETINYTIGVAEDSDTVLVHNGTYYENVNFSGKNLFLASMFTFTGDSIHINNTIINGGGAESVVKFISGENSGAHIDGFCITNGDASMGDGPGGGVCCRNYSTPTVTNLRIYSNHGNSGGGVFVGNFSHPQLTNLQIYENTANVGAGVCVNYDSNPVIRNSVIRQNHAYVDYGGMGFQIRCSPVVTNVKIRSNTADFRGGGLYIWEYSHPTVTNVMITHNTAVANTGGLICDDHCNPRLERLLIANNSATGADGEGGGLYIYAGSAPKISHVTVANNFATLRGGGLLIKDSAAPTIVNSIFWNDYPHEISFVGNSSSMMMAYSNVQGGPNAIDNPQTVYWMEGNLLSEPEFVEPSSGDFTLDGISPCIDAGTASFVWEADTLIDLSPMDYSGDAPDMGAFESGELPLEGDVNGDGGIDVLDIVQIVNFILGYNDFTLIQLYLADFNADGIIDILDVILAINLIMGGRSQPVEIPEQVEFYLSEGTLNVDSWEGIAGIQLKCDGEFHIRRNLLPPGWELHHHRQTVLLIAAELKPLSNGILLEFAGHPEISDIILGGWDGKEISAELVTVVKAVAIQSAYPNPFNAGTNIEYILESRSQVQITVYDILGREVTRFDMGYQEMGMHQFFWDAAGMASGIYFAEVKTTADHSRVRLILLK